MRVCGTHGAVVDACDIERAGKTDNNFDELFFFRLFHAAAKYGVATLVDEACEKSGFGREGRHQLRRPWHFVEMVNSSRRERRRGGGLGGGEEWG